MVDPIQTASIIVPLLVLLYIFTLGFRVVRPTERGLVERLGKYERFAEPGFHWIIPVVHRMFKVNVTEKMVTVAQQAIITKDKLNAQVSAQIYFKVKPEEDTVKASQYNVNKVDEQIVALAQTTLRNIIGTLTLTEANSERSRINSDLMKTLSEETKHWGIQVVRAELREIDPPPDVQETMNKVVKAENEKTAARDFAEAKETQADGERRAAIKIAEGRKQAEILEAEGRRQALILEGEGKAKALETVFTASEQYFKGGAITLRQLEVVENSLKENSVFIVPEDQQLVNLISGIAGAGPVAIPMGKKTNTGEEQSKEPAAKSRK